MKISIINKDLFIHCSWYHHTMSRRQAEQTLESRPAGSFLVRQSESGHVNDYSLSIK